MRRLSWIFVVLIWPELSAAQVFHVPSQQTPTIQSAIQAAPSSGATVILAPGTYTGSAVLSGKSLRISGSGATQTLLLGDPGNPAFDVIGTTPQSTVLSLEGVGFSTNNGGVRVQNAEINIRQCRFDFCTLGAGSFAGRGAAIHATNAVVLAKRTCFGGNTAVPASSTMSGSDGGAVYVDLSSVQLDDCQFVGNGATRGSAVFSRDSVLSIQRCLFDGNGSFAVSTLPGIPGRAAIWCERGEIRIENTLMINGISQVDPGIVLEGPPAAGGTHHIHSTTITSNFSTGPGSSVGALRLSTGPVVIRSSIFWGNTGTEIGGVSSTANSGSIGLDHSIVQQNTFSSPAFSLGAMVFNVNPRFVSPGNGDFHLRSDSPALDSGVTSGLNGTIFDIEGDPRVHNSTIDMGHDERFVLAETCARGGFLDSFGGPLDLLRVNGSAGDYGRIVHLRVDEVLRVDVDQPPTRPDPADYIVWGFGEFPGAPDFTPLPFALAPMCFPPQLIAPSDPRAFTLASTDTSGSLPHFFLGQGTPASFVLGVVSPQVIGGVLTLQGVVYANPSEVRTTNAVAIVFLP